MTPAKRTAYNAGIKAMRQMALAAAVTLETREDGTGLRHQAAIAALQGLAEGAQSLMIGVEPELAAIPEISAVSLNSGLRQLLAEMPLVRES